MEEKQRLAKQQEQERNFKAQKSLVPKTAGSAGAPMSTSTTTSTSSRANTMTHAKPNSSPRDLTATLMQSNMNSLKSSTSMPAASPMVGSTGTGINWQSGSMSSQSSVNWGSTSTPSVPNYSSPSIAPTAAPPSKSNMGMSSLDSLLSPPAAKTPLNQMSSQSMQAPRPAMSMQPPPNQTMLLNSSFGRPGGGTMPSTQWSNTGVSGGGGAGFTAPGQTFPQANQPMTLNPGGGFAMYNNSPSMMMMGTPQQPPGHPMGMQANTARMGMAGNGSMLAMPGNGAMLGGMGAMQPTMAAPQNQPQAKPLSSSDLKDFLG